ncbi:hypothetical protein RCL1_001267 [Eukaryota sp. TZLM3-RCL]
MSLVLGTDKTVYQSLYLDTLNANDLSIRKLNYSRDVMKKEDISGTCPKQWHHKFLRDNVSVNDIDKACPPQLHKPVKAHYLYYRNDDIELSMPPTHQDSRRQTNPLDPQYKLPTAPERPITPPKFLRDSYNVSDIVGTTSAPFYQRKTPHDSFHYSDIHIYNKPLFEKPRDVLDCKDINLGDTIKPKPRLTDPNDPSYTFLDGSNGEPVPWSSPPPPRKFIQHNKSLETTDIEGAKAGWLPPCQYRSGKHVTMVVKKPRDLSKVVKTEKKRLFEKANNKQQTIQSELSNEPREPRRPSTVLSVPHVDSIRNHIIEDTFSSMIDVRPLTHSSHRQPAKRTQPHLLPPAGICTNVYRHQGNKEEKFKIAQFGTCVATTGNSRRSSLSRKSSQRFINKMEVLEQMDDHRDAFQSSQADVDLVRSLPDDL